MIRKNTFFYQPGPTGGTWNQGGKGTDPSPQLD